MKHTFFLIALWSGLSCLIHAQKSLQLLPQANTHHDFKNFAFSADGRWLATSYEGRNYVWDVQNRIQVRNLPRFPSAMPDSLRPWILNAKDNYAALTFLPAGNIIAGLRHAGGDFMKHNSIYRLKDVFSHYSFVLWDWRKQVLKANTPLKFAKSYPDYLDRYITQARMICTPDGSKVVLIAHEQDNKGLMLMVFSTTDGQLILEKPLPENRYAYPFRLLKIIAHPDNQHFLMGWYHENEPQKTFMEVWDMHTGKMLQSIQGRFSGLSDFAADPAGKYLFEVYHDPARITVVRRDLATYAISPAQKGSDAYRVLEGNFNLYASYSYNLLEKLPHFFTETNFLLVPTIGIYDLNNPSNAPLYKRPDREGAIIGEPVPSSGLTTFDKKNFFDWKQQRSTPLSKTERFNSIRYAHEVQFGKSGTLTWTGKNEGSNYYVWELSRLHGIRQYTGREYEWHNTGMVADDRVDTFYNIKTGKATLAKGVGTPAVLSNDHRWAVYQDQVYRWNEQQQQFVAQKKMDGQTNLYYFDPGARFLYTVSEGREANGRRCKMIAQWKLPELSLGKQLTAPQSDKTFELKVLYLDASSDGNWLLAMRDHYNAQLFSLKTGQLAHAFPFTVAHARLSPDGSQVIVAHRNELRTYSLPDLTLKNTFVTGDTEISSFDFSPEGNRVVVTTQNPDHEFVFLRWPAPAVIARAHLYPEADQRNRPESFDYIIWTPEQQYCTSKKYNDHFAFQSGESFFPFENFDLTANRPDAVMKTLGYAEQSYIDLLEKAWQKRLEKQGSANTLPTQTTDNALPSVVFHKAAALPLRSPQRTFKFRIEASDPARPLTRYQIFVNEVPLYGLQGKPIPKAGAKQFTEDINVELVSLNSRIEAQVWNDQGVASPKASHVIQFDGTIPKPDLYLVTIGVSQYKDRSMNLQYAAKDATEIERQFKSRFGAFRNIVSHQYLNEQVTRENIGQLALKLKQTRPEDRVIVFAAGHGLLDAKLNFYFGTYDVDFANPAARGLSFTAIESLVSDIPARQKIILLDACHSGELDAADFKKDEKTTPAPINSGKDAKVVFRSPGNKVIRRSEQAQPFELMKNLFTDLRRQSGAVIISAAAGHEVAMEGGGKANGLFTYALLEGLSAGLPADENEDEVVSVNELQDYILTKVPYLTNGAQKPTYRVEYLYNDFDIWNVKGAANNPVSLGRGTEVSTQKIKDAVLKGADVNGKNEDGATLLMVAAHEYNDVELLQWLVSKGADPRQKGTIHLYDEKGEKTEGYYGSLAAIAAAQGKLPMLKYLIETCKIPIEDREWDAKTEKETGWTALQWAANEGKTEVVQYLLDKGAKPDARIEGSSSSPLKLAVLKGHLATAKLLKERGADWKIKDNSNRSLLHFAAEKGHLEVLRWLTGLGLDINAQSELGWTPAMYASLNGQYHCIDYLNSQKADMTLKSKKGFDALRIANQKKHYAIPEIIAYKGSEKAMFLAIKQRDSAAIARQIPLLKDINAPDAQGGTLLMHLAKETNYLPLIQQMVKRGADLRPRGIVWTDSIDGGFYGNLQGIAAAKGDLNMLRYFIETCKLEVDGKEYDPKTKGFTEWTALQWACERMPGQWSGYFESEIEFEPETEVLFYLLDKGANIHTGKKEGYTPLMMLLRSGRHSPDLIFDLIEKHGANYTDIDAFGRNIIHYFAMYDMLDYRDNAILNSIYAKMDLNKADNEGNTPLMLAAFNGKTSVRILLEKKANIATVNKQGQNALAMAGEYLIARCKKYGEPGEQPLSNFDRLLEAGGKCCLKNKAGKNISDRIREENIEALLDLLEEEAACKCK